MNDERAAELRKRAEGQLERFKERNVGFESNYQLALNPSELLELLDLRDKAKTP